MSLSEHMGFMYRIQCVPVLCSISSLCFLVSCTNLLKLNSQSESRLSLSHESVKNLMQRSGQYGTQQADLAWPNGSQQGQMANSGVGVQKAEYSPYLPSAPYAYFVSV